jgi:phosphatidylglycerophosphate synthase
MPTLVTVGDNPTRLWGMTNAERVRRIAAANKLTAGPGVLVADLRYAWDPVWARHLAGLPGHVLVKDGRPVLAHAEAATGAMPEGLTRIDADDPAGIYNAALRKRERPFVEVLEPATVRRIERASYQGAYKGVTDVLTKYLWPEWAFHLTRLSARIGLSPNGVTAIGTALCIAATVLFWYGWFWTGLAVGLGFMVLDTVDGKLARCTITSSAIGNIWDHGIDLVHPPFWWWAWATGCAAYGRPLSDEAFWWVIGTMLGGYVVQRLIEGAFMRLFGGMHIHVWRPFDSWFRLITARRNPNMVILFASLLVTRPDWGIIAVAVWTVLSLLVHAVQLGQALARRARGEPVTSWLV